MTATGRFLYVTVGFPDAFHATAPEATLCFHSRRAAMGSKAREV